MGTEVGEPLVVRLSLDASAALKALVDARECLLKVGHAAADIPESAIDTLRFDFDPLPASRAGDCAYALRISGFDGVLSAAGGTGKP